MVQTDLPQKSKNIPWEYTSKSVSPWGGMRLMKELVDKTEVLEKLNELPLPRPGSNRGYDPLHVISSFWVCVWLGGARFAHTGLVRFDKVLKDIFEWRKVPSVSTYTRFFGRFTREHSDNVFPEFNRWFFRKIPIKKLTIDFDSTVVPRYGEQEGSRWGYNPNKRGRASHHPLIAFAANVRMVANAWMRPGNTHTANNIYNFFEETLRVIDRVRIGLIRADSGFYGRKFFRYMEERAMKYIVAAKVNAIMKHRIMDITGWLSMEGGVHISEFHYKAMSWKRSRRIIVVRQSIGKRPKAAQGKLLFKDLPGHTEYRYQFYVTNLDLEAKMVWDMYRQRADSENRIKELKHDFGMNGFCLHKFYATEAAFRMVMIAYNMISLFRQAVLKQDTQQYLSTLRFQCFALGSWITKRGRRKVLKLSVAPKRRAWVDGLFSELVHLQAPFPLKPGS